MSSQDIAVITTLIQFLDKVGTCGRWSWSV